MTEWGIDTLFNPGKRHLDEEKRRLQSTREEVGDSSGGRRIDFESGTVTISRRGAGGPAAAPEADEAAADSVEPAAADEAAPRTGETVADETTADGQPSDPQR
ncbi:MAG: hypothetical protein QOI26_937 [Pseudonocardiales bacterium]|jgi:hypothetical protein|nr:hypothetical protein [Pseudonocardiales bacterium]